MNVGALLIMELFLSRYLARAVLVPFSYSAPKIIVGVLDNLRERAPAAIPQVISIINSLKEFDNALISDTVKKIEEVVGENKIDSRLLVQYSLNIIIAKKVTSIIPIWKYSPLILSEGLGTKICACINFVYHLTHSLFL